MASMSPSTLGPIANDVQYLEQKRLFKELFYRKGFQYDNMFDWTVLNLQNERGRSGVSSERPVSVPRGEEQRDSAAQGAIVPATSATRQAGMDGAGTGASGDGEMDATNAVAPSSRVSCCLIDDVVPVAHLLSSLWESFAEGSVLSVCGRY